jgi:hypothetical protein
MVRFVENQPGEVFEMKRTILIASVAVLFAVSAHAANFRCPNGNIVTTSDSISEVFVKCDPPTFKTKRTEGVETSTSRVRYVEVEEWTYNEGPNTLVHYLTFRDGILIDVRTGTFGR